MGQRAGTRDQTVASQGIPAIISPDQPVPRPDAPVWGQRLPAHFGNTQLVPACDRTPRISATSEASPSVLLRLPSAPPPSIRSRGHAGLHLRLCSSSAPLWEECNKQREGGKGPWLLRGTPLSSKGTDRLPLYPPVPHSHGPTTMPAPPHMCCAPGQGAIPWQVSSRPSPAAPLSSRSPRGLQPEASRRSRATTHSVTVAARSMIPVSSPKRDRFSED
ncbi:hypothetical protein NDU88_001271 [Pleurodeles waltl]|uniref:Uncharacterized protein n=1 Tax=Pleurodeles waltl TaxID=8319 RepID=A0AAV7LY95_PLEWA|nr:hypothetical protein NDU88_001271 [Pleurodeles waltl]